MGSKVCMQLEIRVFEFITRLELQRMQLKTGASSTILLHLIQGRGVTKELIAHKVRAPSTVPVQPALLSLLQGWLKSIRIDWYLRGFIKIV